MDNLLIICLVLLSTTIFGKISHAINMPPVVGELLSGVLLGPAILNWLHPNDLIYIFSDLGVIILMFIAGLESNLKLLKKYMKPSLTVAVIGVLLPLLSTYWIGRFFNLNFSSSIFLSIIFVSTSVSISAEILKEMHALNSSGGITILGAAVADDVIGIILLSVVSSLLGTGGNNLFSNHLLLMIVIQIAYFVALVLMIKWIVPWVFSLLKHYQFESSVVILALIICFSFAYAAELIGISSITGAFFAGIAIAQTNQRKIVDQSLTIIGYDFLIPFFFISVGLEINLNGIENNLFFFLVLTILSVVNKLLGAGIGGYLSGFSISNSFMIGAGMISRGEVALIIAQMGLSNHLINNNLYSLAVSAIIMTTLISPLILRKGILIQKKKLSHD
ncbi:sodium:proton antiporter [Philodulcilactobacillus myokoensis]|uniref:Sodium:proton antiporter n=1 Tax=Philodulcilactobacillus myokoensis TaxID=2929573 RepID=A0A9W6ET36_9LACO|nr:cation:proton antiporter [Philodulcilactobacillus myokoensis]GLB47107.1 sodium:proton antiporter [Philodulcilactobacillus myokoensis]